MARLLRFLGLLAFLGLVTVVARISGPVQGEGATAPAAPARAAPPPDAGVSPALPAISVAEVTMRALVDRVHASGLVAPVETVQVQPQVQGLAIEEIAAEVGDRVDEGQILARLSSSELTLQRSQALAQRAGAEAAIAQAEAQLVAADASADEAERVLERARALRGQGIVAQAQLDQADAGATSARAQVSVARQGLAAAQAQRDLADAQIADIDLKLRRTDIRAPVAGEVMARDAMIGAIATSAGPALFTIVRDGKLELLADVTEQDVLKLAPGQEATLTFAGLAGEIAGRVRLVEPQVDAQTRLGRARIAIDEPGRVRSGMFADAVVVAARKTAASIPASAVGGAADAPVVLRVREGVVDEVRVATGIRDGALVEVLAEEAGGLAPGDLVVARAGAFVRAGDRIDPVRVPLPVPEAD